VFDPVKEEEAMRPRFRRGKQPRVKPEYADTYHHCYNRIAGVPGEFPFGRPEKEKFIELLRKLSRLYAVDVVAFSVLGNHWHAILRAPEQVPSAKETCRRYRAYYRRKRPDLNHWTEECAKTAENMRDISCFMHDLQQHFSSWFNRTRPVRRRGTLWAQRFKNTVLEDSRAVWDCWKYIEMNPVRAGLVADPAEYRFSSFGIWSATGKHPFARSLKKCLKDAWAQYAHVGNTQDIYMKMRRELARALARDAGKSPEQAEAAAQAASHALPFSTTIIRRVRYWVDGLVIGSELYVIETMTRARGAPCMAKRRLTAYADRDHIRAHDPGLNPASILYAFKRLRLAA